ncbi:c-type cytochrome [Lentisphaera profundi]|uniref:C-type cytochrome n=1 Tax=Lentisphaera profundi TaxID=1658616 RepID=A0ABY7VSI9_9BACT|nr:DUF6797 domain-containing protein [Lentisphaera profundi]WDE95862.1 c-type cytochrome [Lentisphaera profundi]
MIKILRPLFLCYILATPLLAQEKFAKFIEPDFPFIQSAMDASAENPFPEENVSSKSVLLQLGQKTWACFDTELMRISAIWTKGDFEHNSMAQISYPNTGNKSKKFPRIEGDLLFATAMEKGISDNSDHIDKRALPIGIHKNLNWHGLYLSNKHVVLSYSLKDIAVKEILKCKDGELFSRSFKFSECEDLSLLLFQKTSFQNLRKEGDIYLIDDGEQVLTISVNSGELKLDKQGRIFLRNPQRNTLEINFSYNKTKLLASLKLNLASDDFVLNKTNFWEEEISTSTKLSTSQRAYVSDQIDLPLKNPWKRSVRLAALDFFSDGRAAALSFDGDVWLIDGLKDDLEKVRWRRFASGLYSPLSLQIYKDQIYVLGRDQITRLHDLDNNGEADFYENYSSIFSHSLNTRNFGMDMIFDEIGDIYLAKGGIHDTKQNPLDKKFRNIEQTGVLMKIANEGKSLEIIADGFREPFLAYDPEKQQLYANDQQGQFVPSSPFIKINKGDYGGYKPANHRKRIQIKQPFSWLPHKVEPSCAGMNFIDSKSLGPLNKRLLSHSYNKSRSVLLYEGKGFGAAFPLSYQMDFPLIKGAINPFDGSMYLTGFKIYSNDLAKNSGLTRIRYTGKAVSFPLEVKVFKEGIELRFDQELNIEKAKDINSYDLKRWNYKRSPRYGSGHFKLNGQAGKEEILPVSVSLSRDKKSLFLVIPGMESVDQFSLDYSLRKAQQAFNESLYLSIEQLSQLPSAHYAFKDMKKYDLSEAKFKSKKQESVSEKNGKYLLKQYACIACHSLDGSQEGKLGPTFKGMYGSVRHFEKSKPVKADKKFIKESLLFPNKKVAKGYAVAMGTYAGILSETDIASIILYLKTLD